MGRPGAHWLTSKTMERERERERKMVVALDLQDFLLRARVLKLYRQALRISRRAPPDSKDEVRQIIRQEVENNRSCKDKQRIRFLIGDGLERFLKIGEAVRLGRDSGGLSNIHRRLLHDGPDTIEELFERHVVKNDKKHLDDDENEILTRQRLTSTRREALSLYRDIIRATRFFMWPDTRGILWRDVLRENARKEFEAARFEKDPEVVTRLLFSGRDAVQAAIDKVVEKQKQQIEKEKNESRR